MTQLPTKGSQGQHSRSCSGLDLGVLKVECPEEPRLKEVGLMLDVIHRSSQDSGINPAVDQCKWVSFGEGVAHRLDLGRGFKLQYLQVPLISMKVFL